MFYIGLKPIFKQVVDTEPVWIYFVLHRSQTLMERIFHIRLEVYGFTWVSNYKGKINRAPEV